MVILTRNLSSWMSQANAFHELNPNAGSLPVFPSLGIRPLTVKTLIVNASSESTGKRVPTTERILTSIPKRLVEESSPMANSKLFKVPH